MEPTQPQPQLQPQPQPQLEPEQQQPPLSLAGQSDAILTALKRWQPVIVDGVDPALHYLPPHVSKPAWTALGNLIAAREQGCAGNVSGERWISLRLDGSGFSSAVRSMRKQGVIEPTGFSERFARSMVKCCEGLMEKFNAVLGYTQSDEMVVFIKPTNVVHGERQVHSRSGRVTKTCTLAAGYVTARFNMELSRMVLESGGTIDALARILPHFDCRMGSWYSWEEARSLLLWRAYDCSVNGVSDAVHHSSHAGKKKAIGLGKREKLQWLFERDMLPLPRHQAYGTVLARVKRRHEGRDPRPEMEGKAPTLTLRSRIEPVDGPVLELARQDALFPVADALLPKEEGAK